MDVKQAKLLNGTALAYMGDAVYEKIIREYLLGLGYTKVNDLHRMATHFVSAKAQAELINEMFDKNILTDQETSIFKRGRNAKTHTKAKNTDHATYAKSTGFEALMGYLYLTEDRDRLFELTKWCIQQVSEKED